MNTKKLLIIGLSAILSSISMHASATDVGQAAPVFSLPTVADNKEVSLSQFKGKVVYLDFWASWCAPCRTSFPELNKLYAELKAQGFEVVAINLDEDKSKAEAFLKEFAVDFTVLRDESGKWSDAYVVESMPTSFIIDKEGVVQHVHHGFTTADVADLKAKITELLAKK